MNLDQYKAEDATHYLKCSHCCGYDRCKYYVMKAIPIGKTKSGNIKCVVFGRLYWIDTDHIKKIRYVNPNQIIKII